MHEIESWPVLLALPSALLCSAAGCRPGQNGNARHAGSTGRYPLSEQVSCRDTIDGSIGFRCAADPA